MKPTSLIAITFTLLLCGGCTADAQPSVQTSDKTSYELGYRIAQEMKRKGITLNVEAVIKGIQAQQKDAKAFCETPQQQAAPGTAAPQSAAPAQPTAPATASAALPPIPAGMSAALTPVERDILASNAAPMAAFKSKHAAGMAFLASNSTQPDIKTTASGLQYTITQQGGGATPSVGSTVTLHYKGTGINGQEFINTYRTNTPETIKVKDLLGGLQEAVLLLKAGGKGEFYLPSKLAYGKTHGPLAHQTLIYQVELLSVQ